MGATEQGRKGSAGRTIFLRAVISLDLAVWWLNVRLLTDWLGPSASATQRSHIVHAAMLAILVGGALIMLPRLAEERPWGRPSYRVWLLSAVGGVAFGLWVTGVPVDVARIPDGLFLTIFLTVIGAFGGAAAQARASKRLARRRTRKPQAA